MSRRCLKPGAGERLHQFVVGSLPIVGYLTGWFTPIAVAVGLSLGAMLSVRLVLVKRLGDLLHPPAEDAAEAFYHDGVRRFDEATRAVLLGVGLAGLLADLPLGWLPVLAASSVSILAGTTGFAFTTAFYALLVALGRRLGLVRSRKGAAETADAGNPHCLVCRSLAAAPYERCTWCRLTSVRSCCGLQTSLLMALLLVIAFLLTAEIGAVATKALVTLSILSVVGLALAVTRQTDELVGTLDRLAGEHHRSGRRCDLLRRFSMADSIEAVAEEAVAFTAAALGARRISVMLAEDDVLRIVASRGIPPETAEEVAVPVGERICGRVFASGDPVVLGGAGSDGTGQTLGLNTEEAMASLPLTVSALAAGGRKVGVLNVTDGCGRHLSPADLAELGFVSEATAISLSAQVSRRDFQRANYASIVTLALAMEAKDPYTNGHSRRVLAWAAAMARRLGLSGSRLKNLAHAAELHDIGKLAVPDQILRAPRKLTPGEWTIIQQHPRRGVELVRHLPFLRPVCQAILHHHEWMDGSGYPDGIAGQAIPLEARIIAVIDAYDAMTSERPYRLSLSHEEAAAELERQSGKQFDPDCVAALLEAMGEHAATAETMAAAPTA